GLGIRESWQGGVQLIRDAALWGLPVLLPLSTFLYTFASNEEGRDTSGQLTAPPVIVKVPEVNLITEGEIELASKPNETALPADELPASKQYAVSCPHCAWEGSYPTKQGATNALRAHTRYCMVAAPKPETVSTNGNGHH